MSFFKKCSGIKNIKSKILLVFNFTIDYRGNKQKILMITDPCQFGKKNQSFRHSYNSDAIELLASSDSFLSLPFLNLNSIELCSIGIKNN